MQIWFILLWNNLFLTHQPKRIHGSREIFEKPVQKTPQIVSACFTFFDQISPAPVLLLERERLYESCIIIRRWAKHLSRCWAPGRAAKITERRPLHLSISVFEANPEFSKTSKNISWATKTRARTPRSQLQIIKIEQSKSIEFTKRNANLIHFTMK